ncbi:MAG: glucosamine-6-phosphate deaminase [Planctomycetota bacterium]|nr:MAG: glucosamine-6-phosphate deaminase [Planctomycetota bacterium]
MRTVIANDRDVLGRFVASLAAETLKQRLEEQESVGLVIATGSSQFEVLDALVQQPGIDWSRVHGFHLDEYLGIPRDHPASFCGYLEQRFVSRVPIGSFYFLDGTRPPHELLCEANERLQGQRIDLLLCGIGENGHLAFNDPPADFQTTDPYLIVELDEACRRQQVGEGWFDSVAHVPTQAISMSIRQILSAGTILCSVPDRRKAEAVRNTLESEISPQVPASALRQHSDVVLVLDPPSASLLSPETLQACEHVSAASPGEA